jgi:hypothetical protein
MTGNNASEGAGSQVVDIDAMLGGKGTNTNSQGGGAATNESQATGGNNSESGTAVNNESAGNESGAGESQNEASIKKIPQSSDDNTSTQQSSQEGGDNGEGKSNENQNDNSSDEPIDLDEIYVDYNGTERSVGELVAERDAYAQRVEMIEKDEFLKGLIEHYQATGNVDAYLEVKGKDWDKVSDVDVLRQRFDKENQDLDPQIREKLFQREIANKYMLKEGLSDYDKESEDYQIAQGLLKRDATKAREALKEEQKKFKSPERQNQEQNTQQEKYNPEAYKQKLLADKNVNEFAKSKLLPLDIKTDDGSRYGFETADSGQIIEMMSDDRKFWQTMLTKEGKIDLIKQAKVYAFASNIEAYEQQLVNLGKTLGQEERIKEQKNISDPRIKQNGSTQSKGEPQIGTKEWKSEFLKEAIRQKRS